MFSHEELFSDICSNSLLELWKSKGTHTHAGLWILKIAKNRVHGNIERLLISYILSLALIFSLLYLGGTMNTFNVASFAVLAMLVVSFIHLFMLFTMKVPRGLGTATAFS